MVSPMDMKGEQSYTVTCSSCGNETLQVREIYYEVPRFGTMVIVYMSCPRCGFSLHDTISLGFQGPSKIELVVKGPEGLSSKLIRSTTASISIPELGLELTPGPRSEAFITNVEGLLERFAEIADQLADSSDGETKEKAIEAQERIALAKEGKVPFRIIILDEAGNSAIVPASTDAEAHTTP